MAGTLINLAVVTEAAAGRVRWSLDPRWDTPRAGPMLNRGGIEADRHRRPACYCTTVGIRDDLLAQFARSYGQAWTQTGDRQKQVHGMGGLAQEVGSERSLCAAVTRRRLLMAAAESAVWSISRAECYALALANRWHSVTVPGGLLWVSV